MICPNCGLEISDTANFCNHCGKPVSAQGRASTTGATSATPGVSAETERDISANYVLSSPPDETPERVLWDEFPSMRTAISGIVISILIGAALIIALQFLPIFASQVAQLAITAIIVVIVVVDILRHYIRLHSIRYRLSTQRIFITHGLINKRTDEVELEKYKDIFVNRDFWDNIVGCGDIEVVTSDSTNPTIRIIDVVDPIGKKESIRAAARERKSVLGITRREEL